MKFWRMRLRCGFAKNGGEDMWPPCEKHHVAAITYNGVHKVDLHPFSRRNLPPRWDEVRGGKGSLAHFAWDIVGGDKIFVADSSSGQIVGAGYVSAPPDSIAYRFDLHSPIQPKDSPRWCHLIDVDWDSTFTPFRYSSPRAPMQTVLELNPGEVNQYDRSSSQQGHRDSGLSDEQIEQALLAEDAYSRYTPAAIRTITRKHVALSNCFCKWLRSSFGLAVKQEARQIDAVFKTKNATFLVEFKIAYQGDTRRAIREAMGQLLEYNHYPPRTECDHWFLILDEEPNQEDIAFIRILMNRYSLPLNLGWKQDSGFVFMDRLPI